MNQLRSIAALAAGHVSLPLMGKFYNVDGAEDQGVVFVATDIIDERAVAVVRELRAASEEACLVVFYSGEDPHQEGPALEAGADDCIALAFDYQYLSARLRATMSRLRRIRNGRAAAPAIDVDSSTHQAVIGDRRLPLSPLEFRFLLALRRQRGKVVPHEEIERSLWGEEGRGSREALKHLVHRVRLRLGPEGRYVNAVAGVGYILAGGGAPGVTSPSPE